MGSRTGRGIAAGFACPEARRKARIVYFGMLEHRQLRYWLVVEGYESLEQMEKLAINREMIFFFVFLIIVISPV